MHKLTKHFGHNNVDIYRDDGIAIMRKTSGPEIERMKKKITKLFNEFGLNITS